LACLAAGDAVPDAVDAAEFLDIDVHELAGPVTLVAVGRLARLQAAALPQPDP